jgi:hypothetical protein
MSAKGNHCLIRLPEDVSHPHLENIDLTIFFVPNSRYEEFSSASSFKKPCILQGLVKTCRPGSQSFPLGADAKRQNEARRIGGLTGRGFRYVFRAGEERVWFRLSLLSRAGFTPVLPRPWRCAEPSGGIPPRGSPGTGSSRDFRRKKQRLALER